MWSANVSTSAPSPAGGGSVSMSSPPHVRTAYASASAFFTASAALAAEPAPSENAGSTAPSPSTTPATIGTSKNIERSTALHVPPADAKYFSSYALSSSSSLQSSNGSDRRFVHAIMNASRSTSSSRPARIASSSVAPHASPLLVA